MKTCIILLLWLTPAYVFGQSLPGYDTRWTDDITAEQEAHAVAKRRARQPFLKWQAYIVVASMGSEFVEVRMPPNYQTVHRLENGRWVLEVWRHGRQIHTCQWRGDKAVGLFPVSGEIMECGYRAIDDGFFERCAVDPLWADVVKPQ